MGGGLDSGLAMTMGGVQLTERMRLPTASVHTAETANDPDAVDGPALAALCPPSVPADVTCGLIEILPEAVAGQLQARWGGVPSYIVVGFTTTAKITTEVGNERAYEKAGSCVRVVMVGSSGWEVLLTSPVLVVAPESIARLAAVTKACSSAHKMRHGGASEGRRHGVMDIKGVGAVTMCVRLSVAQLSLWAGADACAGGDDEGEALLLRAYDAALTLGAPLPPTGPYVPPTASVRSCPSIGEQSGDVGGGIEVIWRALAAWLVLCLWLCCVCGQKFNCNGRTTRYRCSGGCDGNPLGTAG